jgi:hypothetical protein
MALRGTLKDFALPDIFQLIGMQRKTGLLTLKSERETVTVVFENGMVVMADSTIRRLDDLLGSVLVRQGKLRKQDLDEVLAKQKASMQPTTGVRSLRSVRITFSWKAFAESTSGPSSRSEFPP